MKLIHFGLLAAVAIMFLGCDSSPESSKGFSLPEGNIEHGKLVFIKYQCLSCHQLAGVEPDNTLVNNPAISVKLGGKSAWVKTYADLLTSVINPSHKLAKGYPVKAIQVAEQSKMPIYNDVMTVTELVDLVTFLQSNYELTQYRTPSYRHYGY